MKTRLITSTLLAAGLLVSGATMAAGAADPAPQNLKTVSAMFAFADQDKDGRLTRDEAHGAATEVMRLIELGGHGTN